MNYDRIDELLSELHMSRRQLAIKAGIKPSTMSMWFCRKTRYISKDKLYTIADALNVNPIEIMPNDMLEALWKKEEANMAYYNSFLPDEITDEQLLKDFHRLPLSFQKGIIIQIRQLISEGFGGEPQCHEEEKKTTQEASPLCPDDQSPIGSK